MDTLKVKVFYLKAIWICKDVKYQIPCLFTQKGSIKEEHVDMHLLENFMPKNLHFFMDSS